MLTLLVPLVPAGASEQPDADKTDQGETGQGPVLERSGARFDISSTPGWTQDAWLWRKGRRLFTISRKSGLGVAYDTTHVVSYDLDSGREAERKSLNRIFYSTDATSQHQYHVRARFAAVDEDGGRLFVPYMHGRIDDPTFNPPPVEAAKDGSRCVAVGADPCLAGVFVLDAATLGEVARVPLGTLTVDGGTVLAPHLVGMSYVAPGSPDEQGKILLLVRERYSSDETGADLGTVNATLHYVVQIDPQQRRVDWVTRAEGCRGNRKTNAIAPIPSDRAIYTRRTNETVLFRGGAPGARVIWVGCYQSNRTATIVKIPLDADGYPAVAPYGPGDPGAIAGKAMDDPRTIGRDDVARPSSASGQEVFVGPKETREYLADPVSERILARVVDGRPNAAEVWWVFDGKKGAFVGTIGIGAYQYQETPGNQGMATTSGLDPSSGRLYVIAPFIDQTRPGGLFITDIRRTPLPQALVMPQFAGLVERAFNSVPIQVDYGSGEPGQPRRLLIRKGDIIEGDNFTSYDIVVDRLPVTTNPEADIFAGRTVDLDEIDGVTQASYDAAARGYAARAILVGGVTAAGRQGPLDATAVDTAFRPELLNGSSSPCGNANRQVVVGFVGPRDAAVVDGNGSRGGAEAVVVDSGTRSDSEGPVSRCPVTVNGTSRVPRLGTSDWEKVWGVGLFGRPPVDEPGVPWQFGDGDVSCVSSDESPQDSFGDPVTGLFASRVDCGADEASGFGYARGVGVQGMNVSEAVSKFRIYRDPGRGIVSRVESIARGVDIGGVVRIDTVRGVAESWANGRAQFVGDADRDAGYDPNCDFERTAGTCFSRSIFGVKSPVYSCGPCGDEKALVEGLSKAFGANAKVRLRDPDPVLRVGSPNGYVAAIQKPAHERFGDVVLNDDLLQTVVPVLEIIRYAPQGTESSGRRGLQVFQFAGVEVSSSYGIQCLLVYDAATNTCGVGPEGVGGLRVALTDADGKPLAGGMFEVRRDVDGDGALGLVDELVADGACVTTDDGTGSCAFEGLTPGGYVVVQKAAPAGFAVNAEPFVTQVDAGGVSTVTFVNTSNVSTVALTVQDEAGKPLSGAQFVVFADPDSDGKVAADAQPAATCTSGGDGGCVMTVPTGAYVLVQTVAPAGLEPIEPVAFVLTSGGQTAAVGVVNYPPDIPQAAPAAAPAVTYDTPVYPPTVATVPLEDTTLDNTVDVAAPSLPEQVGGTIVRVIQAPGDALRLLSRDPKQAAAWTASLMLFALAALAIQRRSQATALILNG